MMVCSNVRIRSGEASAKASPSRPAGSTMFGAVIVMLRSRVLWKVHSKGSRGGRVSWRRIRQRDEDRVTPLSGTQLMEDPPGGRCAAPSANVRDDSGRCGTGKPRRTILVGTEVTTVGH